LSVYFRRYSTTREVPQMRRFSEVAQFRGSKSPAMFIFDTSHRIHHLKYCMAEKSGQN
jgi:hypothetical protein